MMLRSTLAASVIMFLSMSSKCAIIKEHYQYPISTKRLRGPWTSIREADQNRSKKRDSGHKEAADEKTNFVRAMNGSLPYESPFRPMCQQHCGDTFWKTATFEYNWHHSDNFYEYTGYPKAHKWQVHDPHSCIGEWDGRQPGLFVKKNVWVQRQRDGILGGLIISANAFWPNDEQYREYFDAHVPCSRHYPNKKTLKDQYYHQYTTGMVSGIDPVLYGYFEVRAKTMQTQLVNSFWFQGTHGDIVTEIDVFENVHVKSNESKWRNDAQKFTATNAIAANRTYQDITHPKRHLVLPNPADKKHFEPISFRPHTYGLLWTETKIAWFFDGEKFAEINNTHWHKPQRVRFDVETNYDLHGIMPNPGTLKNDKMQFIVQYFRHWKMVR